MRIPTSYIQKCKTLFHVFQAIFTFVTACVMLAVFTKDGPVGGGPKFLFAVVSGNEENNHFSRVLTLYS